MAALLTTFTTQNAIGQREDLENTIYNIAPTDTPFMANGGRGSNTAVQFDWQEDTLAAPVANRQASGDNKTQFPVVVPTARRFNVNQISDKTVSISGSLEAVDKAGRNSEMAYQLSLRGMELKRDMETMLLDNFPGDASDPRATAGLPTWIQDTTTATRGATGAESGFTTGMPTTGATDGTPRAITEALFKEAIQKLFTEGATLKFVMAGPINKQNISTFSGITTNTQFQSHAGQATIVGAADLYVSDFGTVSIVPNRFQRDRDVWFLDGDFYSVDFLRPFKQQPLAKTGDAEQRLLNTEYGLRIKNHKAIGWVADCDTALI